MGHHFGQPLHHGLDHGLNGILPLFLTAAPASHSAAGSPWAGEWIRARGMGKVLLLIESVQFFVLFGGTQQKLLIFPQGVCLTAQALFQR